MKEHTDQEREQKVFKLQSSLVGAGLIIVGLLLTPLHGTLVDNGYINRDGIPATLISHLATAFLIAGIWHAIEMFFSRREFCELVSETLKENIEPLTGNIKKVEAQIHNVVDQIHASRHERMLGFLKSYVESHPELYEELITQSQQLTIVLNNGYVWIHTHRDNLKERLNDPNKLTRFVFLKPGSSATKLMEHKENIPTGGYDMRLQETLSAIQDMTNKSSSFEIYGVTLSLGQAIFLSESRVFVVPRFVVEPSVPPVFIFEKNDHKKSYYKKINEDVEHLLKHRETVPLCVNHSGREKA